MIIGHQKQWQYLKRMADSDRIPHALLFTGRENLGKKTVAIEFLKSFFGKDILSHPDFILVEPIEGEIQISQIRDLNWKLSLKSLASPMKAAIIDKAHLMNPEAQNCFLKTLEEPKGKTLLILIAEYPELLFPTIRSRVQKIKFYQVAEKEIENYLRSPVLAETSVGRHNLSEEEVKKISEISSGRPGLAVDFISNQQKLEEFRQKIKELTLILNSDLVLRFQYAKDLSQKEGVRETLNIWLDYFRNRLISSLNSQKNQVITKKEYSLEKLKNILKIIQNTNFLISTTNVNTRLALEMVMLEL